MKNAKWYALPLIAASASIFALSAGAAEVTGAGASFPAPVPVGRRSTPVVAWLPFAVVRGNAAQMAFD